MPRVLISDKLSEEAIKIFEAAGVQVDFKPGLSAKELKEIIHDYDGLAVRSATKVTSEIISLGSKLQVVGRAGIGLSLIHI